MKTHVIRFCTIVLAMVLATAVYGQSLTAKESQTKEVTVTGQGMSKEEAERDALRKAVERGAGTWIYSQSRTKDFVLIKDSIFARAAGFIVSKDIITPPRRNDDGTWQITIRCKVSIREIKAVWGTVKILLKDRGHPKIMVFVIEKIFHPDGMVEIVEDPTVETRIQNLLLKHGFLLVDRKQIGEINEKDLTAAMSEGNTAKVQEIARRFGAHLFVTGSANATYGGVTNSYRIPLHAYESEANVKCYRSDTAQLLSSIPGEPTRGTGRVWRSAAKRSLDFQAKQIAPKTEEDVLRFWVDVLTGQGGGEVQLHVEGVDFDQFAELKENLKQIKDVKGVSGEIHSNVARLSIQTNMRAEELAEKIRQTIEYLDVMETSPNVIKSQYKIDWAGDFSPGEIATSPDPSTGPKESPKKAPTTMYILVGAGVFLLGLITAFLVILHFRARGKHSEHP